MKPINLSVEIQAVAPSKIRCLVSDQSTFISLEYNPGSESIVFSDRNYLSDTILKNRFQFEKVIRSSIKGNIAAGFTIQCVFIEGFPFLSESDYMRYIHVDRRMGKLDISSCDTEAGNSERGDFHKIYADGSFSGKTKQAGYAGFIEDPKGKREVYSRSFKKGNSNLMELLAVSEGLSRLKGTEKIQVNTDSRFVIRGLSQWIHFWKFNNWQTAYGSKVKFASNWQRADRLCEGKFLEFNWIKGHSGNEEQDFCHQLARQSAR